MEYDYSYTIPYLPHFACACMGSECSYWYKGSCDPKNAIARHVERHRLMGLLKGIANA